MSVVRVPPMWRGQTVVVLGGGPSLGDVDHALWRGRYRAVGVNGTWRLHPDVLFFQDWKFWGEHGNCYPLWYEYRGIVFSTAPQLHREPRVRSLERLSGPQRQGLPDEQQRFPSITNSGHGAICLTYLLGAARIVLLGFDGRANGNWYHNPKPAAEKTFISRFRPGIESTLKPLREQGVELVNATPGSSLELPISDPETELA